MTPPGGRVRRFAARLLDPSTVERLIDPTIADMQWEHERASQAGTPWRRRQVIVEGYAALLRALAVHGVRHTLRVGRNVLADDNGAMRRLLLFTLVWTSVLTLATIWPPYAAAAPRMIRGSFWFVLLLVPQALGVAVPVGFLLGAVGGLHGPPRRPVTFKRTLAASVVCAAVTLAVCFWLIPGANQSFRVHVSRQFSKEIVMEKGPNEMTLSELRTRIESLKNRPDSAREIQSLRWSYHVRFALGLSPVALGLFACGLTAFGRGRWLRVIGGPVLVVACFWMAFALGARVPNHLAVAWVPNLLFALSGVALLHRSTRDQRQD